MKKNELSDILSLAYSDFHVKSLIFCPISTKLDLSRQILIEFPAIKFHRKPSNRNRVIPHGQTDKDGKAKNHFSQLCERA